MELLTGNTCRIFCPKTVRQVGCNWGTFWEVPLKTWGGGEGIRGFKIM